MSCRYCTPHVDSGTGESMEVCDEFVHVDERHNNTLVRLFLWQDRDDGSWGQTVLMADGWPMRTMPIVTSFETFKFCPWCGRKLDDREG